jgi:Chemotaxis response regulator containing a CheY-like receiver domain and a methylesterase domain
MPKIRVLIVEDSDVVRNLLEYIVAADDRLEVAGSVPSAEEAIRVLPTLRPDVISMDINLPGMDGLEATHRIMTAHPTPIVIVSSTVSADEAQTSLEALRAGALAVSEKPVGPGHPSFDALSRQIANRLALMSEVPVIRQRQGRLWRSPARETVPPPAPVPRRRDTAPYRYVGVVASTGGPQALVRLLADLGDTPPAPVLLVQHIPPAFVDSFARWLNDVVPLSVSVVTSATVPQAGRVYLAPGERHLVLRGGGGGGGGQSPLLDTDDGPPVSGQRPSGTRLFESMAHTAGPESIGVLLTGMGEDGAEGLVALRRAGGYTIAEHESTAVVYGMPAAAVQRGGAVNILPLPEIGACVRDLLHGTDGEPA